MRTPQQLLPDTRPVEPAWSEAPRDVLGDARKVAHIKTMDALDGAQSEHHCSGGSILAGQRPRKGEHGVRELQRFVWGEDDPVRLVELLSDVIAGGLSGTLGPYYLVVRV
jgi:hypothetical protein